MVQEFIMNEKRCNHVVSKNLNYTHVVSRVGLQEYLMLFVCLFILPHVSHTLTLQIY